MVDDSGDLYSCGVLTISDKGARGERRDTSGEQLKQLLGDEGFIIAKYSIIPDQIEEICSVLIEWVDKLKIDLIITTGGTGVSPNDFTPEATSSVIEKFVPGICEAMRWSSFSKTPRAILSRGVAGIRAESLIINLPGSAKASVENLEIILKALPHALYKLKGGTKDCGS